VPSVKTVFVTEYELVPETKKVVVKVPYLKAGKVLPVTRLTVLPTSEATVITRFKLLHVPDVASAESCPP
jgi:hypothetical protein